MKNLWQHVWMAAVAFPLASAQAATVSGGSGNDGMALCRRYNNPMVENQVYVAVCSPPYLFWEDAPDSYNTLSEDLTIQGLGGNDALLTVDGSVTITLLGGCSITCVGVVSIGQWTVALEGGTGNDVLRSGNDTGIVTFDGGADHDDMMHTGSYTGNVYYGGTGSDKIVDVGAGLGDYLFGGDNDDCLSAQCFSAMDCGSHDNDDAYWWRGCTVCGVGEFCISPQNCETAWNQACVDWSP